MASDGWRAWSDGVTVGPVPDQAAGFVHGVGDLYREAEHESESRGDRDRQARSGTGARTTPLDDRFQCRSGGEPRLGHAVRRTPDRDGETATREVRQSSPPTMTLVGGARSVAGVEKSSLATDPVPPPNVSGWYLSLKIF